MGVDRERLTCGGLVPAKPVIQVRALLGRELDHLGLEHRGEEPAQGVAGRRDAGGPVALVPPVLQVAGDGLGDRVPALPRGLLDVVLSYLISTLPCASGRGELPPRRQDDRAAPAAALTEGPLDANRIRDLRWLGGRGDLKSRRKRLPLHFLCGRDRPSLRKKGGRSRGIGARAPAPAVWSPGAAAPLVAVMVGLGDRGHGLSPSTRWTPDGSVSSSGPPQPGPPPARPMRAAPASLAPR